MAQCVEKIVGDDCMVVYNHKYVIILTIISAHQMAQRVEMILWGGYDE